MPLSPGTRLGPYEIRAPLGAGGMGEVYRATDTNLGREVAVKVLPDAFAQDAERLARFEREARMLASLSHPNIAIVHGFEQTAGVKALVMELVEGEGLDERIAAGAMPFDEAAPLAKQIAAALEAAHEQGIVHRDLKPANIKVTPDGHVKVLDFGLAKALDPGPASAPAGQSPTITTPAMTQAGVILGTAAYMSPEQAKGRAADKRSDVWAFGCVLYEMLTGLRAYAGEDVSDTLASILKSEPDWTALPAVTPPAIRTLIQRCLVKDRRQRIGDIAVASFVLSEEGGLGAAPVAPRPATDAPGRSRQRLVVPLTAVAIATAALVGLGAWMLRPAATERPVTRFTIALADDERFTIDARPLLALSPDGRQIAWSAVSGQIFIRSVAEFGARIVPGLEGRKSFGSGTPVFSPDGTSLAFYSTDDRTIWRVLLSGGAPVMVCTVPGLALGMSWDVSGIVVGQVGGVLRCVGNGGQPEQLARVEDNEQLFGPQLLPGGKSLLFTLARASDGMERWDRARIVVQSLTSGERHTLVEGGSDGRYVATGHLLYARGGSVFAVPFDPAAPGLLTGARSVIEGVRRSFAATTGTAHFATSESGDLVYIPGPARPATAFALAIADRTGPYSLLKVSVGRYAHARVSRDGTRLAVDTDDGKEADVSTFDLNGTSALRRLTFGGRNRFPVWSPDGQRLAFQSDRDGDAAIFVQRVDGTGVERLTRPAQGEAHVPESWSPDGRHISFAVQKDSAYALWTLSLADGKAARFRDVVSTEPIGSVFSPNGRWIAYHALPPGATGMTSSSGVYVEPFPPSGALYQAPKVGRDFQPVWSSNGSELLYVGTTASGQLASVPVTSSSGITFGRPVTFPFTLTAGRLSASTRAFDVLPDGRFVGVVADSTGDRGGSTPEIRVVLNWYEELKRTVPQAGRR